MKTITVTDGLLFAASGLVHLKTLEFKVHEQVMSTAFSLLQIVSMSYKITLDKNKKLC